MNQTKEHRLGMREKICYGFGDCAANVYVAMGSSFLTAYYTDTVGLAAMAVGTMMLVARIFDGVTDLAMGAVVDKTKSKYGKARPWVLWTAPLMALGLVALFAVPQSLNESQSLIYAYISYIFMNCIVYTANNLPYDLALYVFNIATSSSNTAVRINWKGFLGSGNNPWFVGEVPVVAVSLANPYHLIDIPRIHTYINAYTNSPETVQAVLDKLTGNSPFTGISPVDPFLGREDTKL